MTTLQERLRKKRWHSVVNQHGAVVDKWGVEPMANEAADAIDELVAALRLTVITAAQLGATDMELDEALTALEKYKAKP